MRAVGEALKVNAKGPLLPVKAVDRDKQDGSPRGTVGDDALATVQVRVNGSLNPYEGVETRLTVAGPSGSIGF
jgi:hypothetical protein